MATVLPRVMMRVCTHCNPRHPYNYLLYTTCQGQSKTHAAYVYIVSKETLSPTLNERHMVEFTLISSNFEEEVLGGRSSSTRHTGTVRTCGMKPVPTYLLSLAWTFYCRWGLHAKNAIILPLSKASQAASTTFSLSHVIRMCVVCLST